MRGDTLSMYLYDGLSKDNDKLESEYMKQEFKFEDGMVVVTRDGKEYTVKGDRMYDEEDCYLFLGSYNSELECVNFKQWDIMSITKPIYTRKEYQEVQINVTIEEDQVDKFAIQVHTLASQFGNAKTNVKII